MLRGVARRPSIHHSNGSIASRGEHRIVRHKHNRGSIPRIHFAQEVEDRVGTRRVKIAGGLISEQQRGIHRQCTRHCHALFLSAGQPAHGLIPEGRESKGVNERRSPCNHRGIRKLVVAQHGHHDILECGECGEQVMVLEHKTDAVPAQPRQRLVVERGGLLAADGNRSRGRMVEQPDEI